MSILLNVVLAFTEGVPQLDGFVAGGGDDLAVISRKRDRENIVGVAYEATGRGAVVQVPEA
ncbi:hypothetical protein BC936DRAFT_149901 [Jimgerdemannia flammicorona]|uniref:Uncharacterized protein n=2 Tax=Jimgerdemannia flammicorona TaxID=994334 RepID=A0A433R0K2_9FUNG|nr:hypothetical protein BC936DRAFT_149901 [Jimgerdemannia flammicorona]RUS35572.1 hypothetical protein BC938DRAFT_476520 [Jimgerdemannia flammicorona]